MMLILLGLIDIIISILTVLMAYGLFFKAVIIAIAIYLVIKGLLFIKSPPSLVSIFDMIAGIILLGGIYFAIPPAILWIIALFLFQKGVMSFF